MQKLCKETKERGAIMTTEKLKCNCDNKGFCTYCLLVKKKEQ